MDDPALDWLLADDHPAVAYAVRRDLLGEDPGSRRLRALRARVTASPPVAAILDRLGEAEGEPAYGKYRGAYWTLIFLADLEADGGDPRVARLAERVLADQLPSGGFAPRADPRFEIVCLTANLLRALVRLGHGGDGRMATGFRRLAGRIVPAGGVPCRVMDEYSVMATCKMTLPQTLRAVVAAPNRLAKELAPLRALLVEPLLRFGVDRYVRPDARSFHQEAWPARVPGTPFKVFKEEYRASHPVADGERRAKPGWARFGFPSSYNSDLLEGLLALAEAGVGPDPRLDEALDRVAAKRGPDGRWRLEKTLNGKMLADVERKGAPSRWLTYRALRVLAHFGRA